MVNTQAVIAFITAAFPTAKRYWRHEGWCVSPQGEKEQNHMSTVAVKSNSFNVNTRMRESGLM